MPTALTQPVDRIVAAIDDLCDLQGDERKRHEAT
jgi:hypothetical protein